jgi:outer membrane protein assembly factor BamB
VINNYNINAMYRHILIPAFFLLMITFSCSKSETQIAEFRGPDRYGIFNEEGLMKSWPENGPESVFLIDSIGDGYGSPVISDGLMFFTGAPDSVALLYCYDLYGNKLWTYELGEEWVENYPGSRSAPTVKGNLLYVGTGMGNLYCIDIKKNQLVWSKDFRKDFQGVLPLFGHSESPYVYGDKVFWTAGGEEYNVIALNRFTGDLIWSSEGLGERSAYHPPRVVVTPSGRSILLTFSAYHLMAFDTESGKLLWTHEQDNYSPADRKPGNGDTHSNTVIYEDGNIYYAAGDGNCGVRIKISDDGSEFKEVWRNKGFDSYMGGIVKIGNHLYGSGTARPKLFSIHAETGIITDSLAIGRGVVIAADNMIYFYSQQGSIHLVAYDQGKLKDVSSFRIEKGTREHFSHPVIHQGVLYVRRGNAIMGFSII